MSKRPKKEARQVGLPPGTLIPREEKKAEEVKVRVIDYDEENFEEKEIETIEECFPFKDTSTVTWINLDGIHDIGVIEKIGRHFGIHPLTLEDIIDTGQRPKMEDFDNYLFVVLKMLYHDEKEEEVQAEHISIILGSGFVISFQEREGDVFDPVRERIRRAKGRIRKMGADYLTYALIDTIVDNYFLLPEKLSLRTEFLHEEALSNPTPKTLEAIQTIRRQMMSLRKSIWPLREVISRLERGESDLIEEPTRLYLRDVYDHTIQAIDTIETSRDSLSGMLEVYLSSISNRMNQVMKVLTIVATIFIPLTFIAGIYGMNFRNIPELEWRWGYPLVLLAMVGVVVSMLVYFKRKRWL